MMVLIMLSVSVELHTVAQYCSWYAGLEFWDEQLD